MLIAIWAMTKTNLVGKDNGLPWHIKEEFAHFRKTTLNQDVIMGKNTFLSLPKVLDKRNIYVLSDDPNFHVDHPNVKIINGYEEVIKQYLNNPNKDLYVLGGIYVYETLIPLCDKLIVSIIKKEYEGNRYLKNIDLSPFKLMETKDFEEFNVHYYDKK